MELGATAGTVDAEGGRPNPIRRRHDTVVTDCPSGPFGVSWVSTEQTTFSAGGTATDIDQGARG